MKKRVVIVFFVGLNIFFISFQSVKKQEEPSLRVLMRNMLTKTDSLRTTLMAGKEVNTFAYKQEGILTAKSVNRRARTKVFKTKATEYLTTLNKFNKADKLAKKEAFNLLVKACLNCHEKVCRGPIMRIEKLYISE